MTITAKRLRLPPPRIIAPALSIAALFACGCSAWSGGLATTGSAGGSAGTSLGVAATASPTTGALVSVGDKQWAAQALQVLNTVDAGVKDYHNATQYPAGSGQRQQLTLSAYSHFQQAVAAHELLLPVTRQVRDSQDRDQYMFVLGNIGGFLTPTPDLPADPPTLGDRIARSLDNAIAGSASLRPRLERIANS